MKDYQKILLYLYPKLGGLIRCAEEIVRAKAVASGTDVRTEQCIEKIIEYIRFRDELVVLSEKMDKIFATLGTEERYLLEYKYFRRKSRLEGEFAGVCVSCSERTYFRRQARLASKLNGLFVRSGLDEGWFMRSLGAFPYIQDALAKLGGCGEGAFADKRAKSALACRPPEQKGRKLRGA